VNRSQRAVLTTAAASTLAAAAAAALAVDGLAGPTTTVPVAQPISVGADPGQLQDAIDRLTAQTDALQKELTAARSRLAAQQAPPPAPAPAAGIAPAPSAPAPAVHARTGASSAAGKHEGGEGGHD